MTNKRSTPKGQHAYDITYRNKFFWISTLTFFVLSEVGFWAGGLIGVEWIISEIGEPEGMGVFFYAFIGVITAIIGWFLGIILTLIIDHRLAKRWRGRLGGGKHPALKLTALSFLTFLGLFILYLYISSLFTS